MLSINEKYIKKIERPSWDEYFLSLLPAIKSRSMDFNTKHSCVLVDENNHIVGTGYNSFPRGFPDDVLPNYRPPEEIDSIKHRFMVHSEVNAIANLTTKAYKELTCYLSGPPCLNCLCAMHQNKVTRIVISEKYSWAKEAEEKDYWHEIFYHSGIKLETLTEEYLCLEISPIYYNWVVKRKYL